MRLTCWLTIYVAAQVSVVLKYGAFSIFLVLLFPAILGVWVLHPFTLLLGKISTSFAMIGGALEVSLGYAAYLYHLVATMRVRSRILFDALLVVLVLTETLTQSFVVYEGR